VHVASRLSVSATMVVMGINRSAGWIAAGVVVLLLGAAWTIFVTWAPITWPGFLDPYIRWLWPAVMGTLAGAGWCFGRAAVLRAGDR
jgi:hypothetical protein